MIKEFKVIETSKTGEWTNYKYKFKLKSGTFYSNFFVSEIQLKIAMETDYYKEPEYQSEFMIMSKEVEDEIKQFILKQKDIRLRHLINPYKF